MREREGEGAMGCRATWGWEVKGEEGEGDSRREQKRRDKGAERGGE